MEKTRYSIIGCGVVGLAIAEALSRTADGDIVVFEKHHSFGEETSSRNSEVVHAGLYYPPDSLKSILCRKGNRMLYEYCGSNGIPHSNCGKLVVSTSEEEAVKIASIHSNAVRSGVPGIKLLSKAEAQELEPDVFTLNALYSGTTGIIDSHRLMKHLYDTCESRGVMFAFESEVKKVDGGRERGDGYVLSYGEADEVLSEYVINAAGLGAEKIAKIAGFDTERLGYRLYFCKGDYFQVSGPANRLKHLVYPPPHEKGHGLGIHATLNLAGHIRLGPDTEYVEDLHYDVSPDKAGDFYVAAKKYLPWLKEKDVLPDTAGMRPKLQGPDDGFRDFVIKEESENGFPKFINLIGIESPGLTASLAIGEHVKELCSGN